GGSDHISFTLQAHGKASGPIGQLDDGQNRVGGGLPMGQYTLKYGSKGGEIVDGKNRGCILTPPTTQFQCDQGVGGTPGFDISCDKKLLYHGSPEFSACPVNDHGEWNVYTKPAPGQKKCISITLTAHGDFPSPPSCNKPAPKPATPAAKPCKYKMPEACPTDLDGEYEFPHLIIPVDQAQPEKAFGNQFNGTITDSVCTAYNFDVHPRFAGKACSLVFLFPEQQDLETSAYDFSGSDSSTLGVFILHKPVEHNTTWSTLPRKTLVAKERIYPGKKMNIIQKECPAGLRVGVMLCGKGFSLEYFQDFNPSPIGLYIRAC
ncbi:hypothetical protein BU26DRAFT_409495, partial [Trematosphaeria pertusa]